MSFKVKPEYVRTFAGKLETLAGDTPAAEDYVRTYLDIGYAEARLFATIAKACDDARQALEKNYQALQKLADESRKETAKAAQMYEDTDEDKARRMDATYAVGDD